MPRQPHKAVYPTDDLLLMQEENRWVCLHEAAHISSAAFCLSSDIADYTDAFEQAEAVADVTWQRRKAGFPIPVADEIEEFVVPKANIYKAKPKPQQTITLKPQSTPVMGKQFVRLPMRMGKEGKVKHVRSFVDYQRLSAEGWQRH